MRLRQPLSSRRRRSLPPQARGTSDGLDWTRNLRRRDSLTFFRIGLNRVRIVWTGRRAAVRLVAIKIAVVHACLDDEPIFRLIHKLMHPLMGHVEEFADFPERQAVVVQAARSTPGERRSLMLATRGVRPQLR